METSAGAAGAVSTGGAGDNTGGHVGEPVATGGDGGGRDVTGGISCNSPDGIVINEIFPVGTILGDVFIELYNPTPQIINLSGWLIQFSRSVNDEPKTVWEGASSNDILPWHFFVIRGEPYVGPTDATFNRSVSLGDTGGLTLYSYGGLFNGYNVIDGVAFGDMASAIPNGEGTPTWSPRPGKSLSRYSDGCDTNNNVKDFEIDSVPTPGSPNARSSF